MTRTCVLDSFLEMSAGIWGSCEECEVLGEVCLLYNLSFIRAFVMGRWLEAFSSVGTRRSGVHRSVRWIELQGAAWHSLASGSEKEEEGRDEIWVFPLRKAKILFLVCGRRRALPAPRITGRAEEGVISFWLFKRRPPSQSWLQKLLLWLCLGFVENHILIVLTDIICTVIWWTVSAAWMWQTEAVKSLKHNIHVKKTPLNLSS